MRQARRPGRHRRSGSGEPEDFALTAYLVLDGVAITDLGRLDNACPSCSAQLTKRPARKTTCCGCGFPIHVRTRPLDRQRVLVTADQVPEIGRQWQAMSEFKRFLAQLAFSFPEFQPLYDDVHTGRCALAPIDWARIEAVVTGPMSVGNALLGLDREARRFGSAP